MRRPQKIPTGPDGAPRQQARPLASSICRSGFAETSQKRLVFSFSCLMKPFFMLVLAAIALAVVPGSTAQAQAPGDGGPAPVLAPPKHPSTAGPRYSWLAAWPMLAAPLSAGKNPFLRTGADAVECCGEQLPEDTGPGPSGLGRNFSRASACNTISRRPLCSRQSLRRMAIRLAFSPAFPIHFYAHSTRLPRFIGLHRPARRRPKQPGHGFCRRPEPASAIRRPLCG